MSGMGVPTAKDCLLHNVLVISIIDDDPPVRLATAGLLRALGHVSLSFDSAESFLQQQQARSCDCIVADIHMPGMSGIELHRTLLARGDLTPLVFMTGAPQPHGAQNSLQGDPVFILQKPFAADALIAAIRRAMATQDARPATIPKRP
jgi:FixJ family two-component response regulator